MSSAHESPSAAPTGVAAAVAADPPPQQQQQPRGSDEPWRRDEVVNLLRAWRQVVSDIASSGSDAQTDTPSIKARIFEAFCALYNENNGDGSNATSSAASRPPPRSFKSLMKTKKSLLRAYRFIAVFNQNHVIARSMSAMGGRNWFSLPEDEQRRVVAAHYKRKPFAYIDEDMFDAIEMIQEAANPSNIDADTATVGSDPVSASPGLQLGDDDESLPPRGSRSKTSSRDASAVVTGLPLRTRAGTPGTTVSVTSSSSKASTNAWMREDILHLLRAWEATFDDPRVQNEPVAVFDNCVHEAFGKSLRSAIALKIKRYSLTKSYKFITDFNKGKYASVGGAPVAQCSWFALTKKQRNAVVLEHYKKTHFTHLDDDMMAPIARIIKKSQQFEPATAQKAKRTEPSKSVGSAAAAPSAPVAGKRVPSTPDSITGDTGAATVEWDRRETTLLLRAWRDTLDALAQSGAAPLSASQLDARIYQRFVVLSEGDTSRADHEVVVRRAMLTNTHDLIVDFNDRAARGAADAPTWFSMRRSERRALVQQSRRPCVDMDEATFNALSRILTKDEPLTPLLQTESAVTAAPPVPVQPSPVYTKGLNVWSNDEMLLLVHAWAAIVAEGPLVENEPLYAFNTRIFKKFVELSHGRSIRTDKALIAKRESMLQSYHFIHEYNQGKIVAARTGTALDWFALTAADQKYVVKVYFKKTSFSYLDETMLELLDTFLDASGSGIKAPAPKRVKASPTSGSSAPSAPAAAAVSAAPVRGAAAADVSTTATSFKPRPNAWTRDELFYLLRAWRELATGDPRQAKESLGSFNARIHQRFLTLARGTSVKPEASVRSKRQLLTSTFEFIADFNRKNFLDWFSLRESDRKKHIVNANRVVHTCSNIEEDVFEALTGILGDQSVARAGTRPSSAVFRQQQRRRDRAASSHDTGSDDDDADAAGAGGSASADETAASSPVDDNNNDEGASVRAPASVTQADRKRHLVANVLAHIGEQQGSEPGANSPTRKKLRGSSNSSSASDLSVIAGLFETQTQHLASLLEQIKDERRVEHEERRALLARIQYDQEERQRDREERALEREHMKHEWEQFRAERRAEREQDRLLLKALLAQKENVPQSSKTNSDSDADAPQRNT